MTYAQDRAFIIDFDCVITPGTGALIKACLRVTGHIDHAPWSTAKKKRRARALCRRIVAWVNGQERTPSERYKALRSSQR